MAKKKKKRTVPMLGLGKLLKRPCPQCSGTGRHPVTGKKNGCPGCKGRAA